MSTLRGRIRYHLHLNESSNDIAASRKRKQSTVICPENKATDISGFLFYPDPETSCLIPDVCCYLLALPLGLLKTASEAAAYGLPVCIDRCRSVSLSGRSQKTTAALLEIPAGGLRLLVQPPLCQFPWEDFWTLSLFRMRELVEGEEMKGKKESYLIMATVDAISPIIALDPQEPFCIVELYDKTNDENSCVLVLTGYHALVWQPAIQPGHTLYMQGAYRKSWKVPNSLATKAAFQHLADRVPPFAFVLSSTSRLFWGPQTNNEACLAGALPSTAVPLVSIEGTVQYVERKLIERGPSTIRFISSVDVEPDRVTIQEGRQTVYRLLLAHFPMSIDLQLSLQTKARIRAVNLHPIEKVAHLGNGVVFLGACLRSTVTLVQPASDEASKNLIVSPYGYYSMKDVGHLADIIPYRLCKVRLSYQESLFKRHVQRWLEGCFGDLDADGRAIALLPVADDFLALKRQRPEKDSANSCSKDFPNRNNSTGARNPYAEFFDHAFNIEDDTLSHQQDGLCGCHMSRDESSPYTPFPLLVGLNDVRMVGLRSLAERFKEQVQLDQVAKRWHGSIRLSTTMLQMELRPNEQNHSAPIFVGGYSNVRNGEIASLSDRICQLPLQFRGSVASSTGDFITGQVENVIVSCFCILSPQQAESLAQKNTFTGDSMSVQSLPPLHGVFFGGVLGGGALVRLGDYVLVASVQLHCSGIRTIARISKNTKTKLAHQSSYNFDDLTLTAALQNFQKAGSAPKAVRGLLVRSRLRHAKINPSGLSNCLVLTLCEISEENDTVVPCSLQTVDVKVAVPHNSSNTVLFKRALVQILSEDMQVLQEEYTLAISWWTIAESYYASALVVGGWDESKDETVKPAIGVLVSLPGDAFVRTERGFVRCATNLPFLRTRLVAPGEMHKQQTSTKGAAFDFVSQGKFFDGMLCRRHARRTPLEKSSQRRIGEIRDLSSADFIPSCSLSDLFSFACSAIQSGDPCLLSPSLVRRISQASFLGMAFCCATCKCSSCFQSLVTTATGRTGSVNAMRDDGDEATFWHLPTPAGLRLQNGAQQDHPVRSMSRQHPSGINRPRLRCPNQCAMAHHYVHWECSGFIDDGTGQAKIYAEREAALSLLGIDEETLKEIEKGIWSSQTGTLSYSKSIPPSTFLKEQVNYVLSKATRKGPRPLDLLPPDILAEYLLYQYCRTSTKATRKLDYFVRCAPLHDRLNHLNHTVLESFVTTEGKGLKSYNEIACYTLPPLKLNLVDCSTPQ